MKSVLGHKPVTTIPQTFGPYQDRKGQEFFAKILTPPYDFTEEKKGFEVVFHQVNTAKALGADDLETICQTAFADEIKDLGKQGVIYVRLETADHKFLGYFSLEDLDIISPGKYPSHSIFWRQLYILSEFQRRGIATVLLKEMWRVVMPHAEHMYLVTRRHHKSAINLYKTNGFIESHETFHGWDPEKFISLEWHAAPLERI